MVYLLHFDQKYKHAQHYIGYAEKDLQARINQHRVGKGARLMKVVVDAGIGFEVARVWDDGDKKLERKLKRWHRSKDLCPVCKQIEGEN